MVWDRFSVFVPGFSSLSNADVIVPRLASNYSPLHGSRRSLDARVHVQLKRVVGREGRINAYTVINDGVKETRLSKGEKGLRKGMQRDTEKRRAGSLGGRGVVRVEGNTSVRWLLASIHYFFHLQRGDCRLKGNFDACFLCLTSGGMKVTANCGHS